MCNPDITRATGVDCQRRRRSGPTAASCYQNGPPDGAGRYFAGAIGDGGRSHASASRRGMRCQLVQALAHRPGDQLRVAVERRYDEGLPTAIGYFASMREHRPSSQRPVAADHLHRAHVRSGRHDARPPSPSVTSPANNATVSGASVSRFRQPHPTRSVSSVFRFRMDGVDIGSRGYRLAPYARWSWNTTTACPTGPTC